MAYALTTLYLKGMCILIVDCYIKVLEMCWNETHDRLSRIMMPGVDPKVIYRVNRAMDNLILGRYTSIAI